MRETALLTKTFLDKQIMLKEIEKLGNKYNYAIVKEDTYEDADIDFYTDESYDFIISFRFILEKKFEENRDIINNQNHYVYLVIQHSSELLGNLNILLKEIMTLYPEMYVTDELYKEFYNIEDIKKGNVSPWLKVK